MDKKKEKGVYNPSARLYRKCRLDAGQADILVPPIVAGNLRYTIPLSRARMNACDIGSGIVVAFTKTHFIMALENSYCWRVGYDCIRSYQYASRKSGGCKRSGREHELEFYIGLEHTYTNTSSKKTAGFGFDITWWQIKKMADECVPLIQKAIDAAPAPVCPACGVKDLWIPTENIQTGVLSSGDVSSRNAVCHHCGIHLQYSAAAGAWMPEKDEDLFRCAITLSADENEMTDQVDQILNQAESMIAVTEKIMKTTQGNVSKQMKEANLATTVQYAMMTNRQRKINNINRSLNTKIPMLESVESIRALIFNYSNTLEKTQQRLHQEIEKGESTSQKTEDLMIQESRQRVGDRSAQKKKSYLERANVCYSRIDAFAAFLSRLNAH